MEAFIGTWKLIESEGFNNFLRETGAGEEVIAVLSAIKPVVTISQEDEIVNLTVQSSTGIEETSFTLGKEFHVEKKDGRHCKVVVDVTEDQLIQVEKWDSKEAISVIEVKDEKLIKTTTFKDVKAVQTFQRV
ncbi:hypothetical protein KOW79_019933 [Hemibagrus wyckioides]|uniref:Cytosolic fatty-acid binding proteins domain-containing protein n=1 Tax=Hemibagrus wyckioides TaxID=337641 RepID=A0A9D3N629_9TELE|nr:fatty acid-binding protein, brain-like [Hemibagrus wyckioides]KAG7316392.1 hypothetical protein KOW79_019933 [Hemibagrus wyckioides]